MTSILIRWNITIAEFTELVDANPSLRGIMLGYVAELQLRKFLPTFPGVHYLGKGDDHNRDDKGDCLIEYKGRRFRVEVKSLQTKTIKRVNGKFFGKAQVDASDRRPVLLPDGSELKTTCLLRGDFDILAVNCFSFDNQWRFVFAANADLPASAYKEYSEYQRQHLLATMVSVVWPPESPFYDSLIPVLNALVKKG
jgi:hypothetical protein